MATDKTSQAEFCLEANNKNKQYFLRQQNNKRGVGVKKYIVAIIQQAKQDQVIYALQEVNVPGASVMFVKGYGEYINQFSRDSLSDGIRLEVLVDEKEVNKVVNVILENAWTGLQGDGVVTVSTVDEVYRVRDKLKVS